MTLIVEKASITSITLNRPDVHNALNDLLLSELTRVLEEINQDASIRCVILKGKGKSFCAGADLKWMQKMSRYSREENYQDSLKLDKLMHTLKNLSKTTIAVARGNVYGGGVGLVACCDIAIAEKETRFCLSEVKLGLIPAVISPYVIEAIGVRNAARYFQTAEVFKATKAYEMRLIHDLYDENTGEGLLNSMTSSLLEGGPTAQAQAKKLIADVKNRPLDQPLREELAQRIADSRASPEGQDGLGAFLNKTKAKWIKA